MEEKSTLARPYALAAFKHAQEENKLDQWSEMLRFLASVTSDPTMVGIIADPRVARARLTELVLDISKDKLSNTGQNFVRVLAENGRLSLMREIANLFEKYRAEHEKQSRVEVTSAFELDPKYEQAIRGAMEKRLGQAVELSMRIDKALIGGVVIRAGDVVIDASLRGRLNQLRLELS